MPRNVSTFSRYREPVRRCWCIAGKLTKALLDDLHDHDGSPYDGISVEYVADPVTGVTNLSHDDVFRPDAARRANGCCRQRQNANRIVTVLEGNGHSVVGDRRVDWEPFDTFLHWGGEWCAPRQRDATRAKRSRFSLWGRRAARRSRLSDSCSSTWPECCRGRATRLHRRLRGAHMSTSISRRHALAGAAAALAFPSVARAQALTQLKLAGVPEDSITPALYADQAGLVS